MSNTPADDVNDAAVAPPTTRHVTHDDARDADRAADRIADAADDDNDDEPGDFGESGDYAKVADAIERRLKGPSPAPDGVTTLPLEARNLPRPRHRNRPPGLAGRPRTAEPGKTHADDISPLSRWRLPDAHLPASLVDERTTLSEQQCRMAELAAAEERDFNEGEQSALAGIESRCKVIDRQIRDVQHPGRVDAGIRRLAATPRDEPGTGTHQRCRNPPPDASSSARRGVRRSSTPNSSAPTTGTASPAGSSSRVTSSCGPRSPPPTCTSPTSCSHPSSTRPGHRCSKIVGHVMVSSGVVDWVEVGGDPTAAVVPEGTAKPEAAFTVTPTIGGAGHDRPLGADHPPSPRGRLLHPVADREQAAPRSAQQGRDGHGRRLVAADPAGGDRCRPARRRSVSGSARSKRPGSPPTPSPSTRPTTPRWTCR